MTGCYSDKNLQKTQNHEKKFIFSSSNPPKICQTTGKIEGGMRNINGRKHLPSTVSALRAFDRRTGELNGSLSGSARFTSLFYDYGKRSAFVAKRSHQPHGFGTSLECGRIRRTSRKGWDFYVSMTKPSGA
jgi:hypothetical protein